MVFRRAYRVLLSAGACQDLKHLLAAVVTSSMYLARFPNRRQSVGGAQHHIVALLAWIGFQSGPISIRQRYAHHIQALDWVTPNLASLPFARPGSQKKEIHPSG
jgi:hypothetical protein